VNYIALEFTSQKNGVRGEMVGLGRKKHQTHCPVVAIIRRIRHLRAHRAALTTPLYSYFDRKWQRIDTANLTMYLRNTVLAMGAQYGTAATDISIQSLHSSSVMSLLCAKVDTNMIRLLGQWRSDEMLCYLHIQTLPLIAPHAAQMLRHGHFTLMENQPIRGNGGATRSIHN
jgi:hypothetical protein